MKKESDLIWVKRTSHSQLRTFKSPVIKLELKNGRFIISDVVCKALKVGDGDGLMFGFNMKEKLVYVVKDIEDDAYILKRKDPHTLRFSSKDLMQYFNDTFGLLETGKSSFIFNVDLNADKKGLHKIELK